MDKLDGSDHYSKSSEEPTPSLLTIILDTHPSAWALLNSTLPFPTFLAHLLVFINAHLACNNSNQICVIAAHPLRAEFLYPPPSPSPSANDSNNHEPNNNNDNNNATAEQEGISEATHYRPFLSLQRTLLSSLTHLLKSTPLPSLETTPSIALSGALTLALTHHNRLHTSLSTTTTTNPSHAPPTTSTLSTPPPLSTRILLISLTGSLSAQYIPLTNTIFACQRLNIPISIAKLAGDTAFLEQASDSTRGTYLHIDHPRGLLQYLMMAFLPNPHDNGNNVFCAPPENAVCLTCGTQLKLGNYGSKPAVVVRKKKKKRKDRLDGVNGDTGSGAATPMA
ncbi:MAG: hypothetical protein Q9186_002272 [Xanthomendoza sp. 1 TL-2023]